MTATDCLPLSHRLFVTDKFTGRRFLVDTGSDLCCLPKSYVRGLRAPATYELVAANGSKIQTYGLVQLNLNLGLRRDLKWSFVVADVSGAIIGADLLAHYNLLPDCAKGKLRDGKTGLSIPAVLADGNQPSVKLVSLPDTPYAAILAEFPSITRPPGTTPDVSHSTLHYIKTTEGSPVTSRPRRLAPHKLRAAQKEFEQMVQVGVARPSSSPWSSPLHLVPKKDFTYRPCGDYRALNARTVPDRYPVRHIGDYSHNIAGSSVFSTVDLVKAYQQIPVFENDIQKTAIITPFGLFEFPYMTFGLRNAGQTFQRFIDEVVRGLDFCFAYVDDILVYSKDPTEHAIHLRALFQRLHNYGVVINPSKCVFGADEVTFLGYRINAAGTRPPEDRIQALADFPPPKSVQGMRRFLGMLNYYRRFLPNAAKYQAPLIDAVAATNSKGAKPFPWTPDLERCFDECKASLTTATTLTHPDAEATLGLFTDASSTHIGACLQQRKSEDDDWMPLAYYSKKLSAKQAEWPAYYRELLGVYESVQHFRHILEAQHATIYTDHKPLIYAFIQRREKLPPSQLNQLSFISQFTTDIRHIKGEDNVVADAMSRVEALSLEDDYHSLAISQDSDPELAKLLASPSSLKLTKVSIPGTNVILWCDNTTSRPRPYLTPSFRRPAFDRLHNLSHPSMRESVRLVSDRFVWPLMKKDCKEWARTCLQCQRSKVNRHVSSPLGRFDQPSQRFRHVHIDIIGPLPHSDNFTYCLTAVDRYSRWPEVWPMSSITAEEVSSTLLTGWIARYGIPTTITTDQGRQFESDLFKRLMHLCGINRIRTTAYHPCANGMVERMHRQLKAALMCHNETWCKALPLVLLGIRSSLKEDLGFSSAELLYGEPLRLPGELLTPSEETTNVSDPSDLVNQLRKRINVMRPKPTSHHAKPSTFVFKDLATASHVMLRDDTVRRSMQPPYCGPYRVLHRSDKTFKLDINGKENTVSIDRLKPAYIFAPPDTVPLSANQAPAGHSPTSLPANPPDAPIHSPASPPHQTAPQLPPPAPSRQITTRAGRKVRFRDILDL
ncbi:hypothetical protein JYU34_006448 [Plutella xylostella]|uniref:RNA-directed DNA polymerase n=1 Tax=Plutella xylostella TaxID=51655 RepID=A0ABQ7QRZ9_PLUXY|nr:hypothetical protein JYU34_006448 [Plutella xylostella]